MSSTLRNIARRAVIAVFVSSLAAGCRKPAENVRSLALQLDGKIGEVRELDPIRVVGAYVGGSDENHGEFVWEAPAGWVILSADVTGARRGNTSYTVQLTAKDSNFAEEWGFTSALTYLDKEAQEFGDDKAKGELESARSLASKWFSTFRSKNTRLAIPWSLKSEEVRGPRWLGSVKVDTHTASLNLSVKIKIARSLTSSELALLNEVLKERIKSGESVSEYFSRT